MANDKNFKVKNDIQAPVYYENVGTISIGSDVGADINLAEYSGNLFNVASQETQPTAVEFKPDGTKMYVIGYTGDDINEYSLSTAWDISTATFTTNSVSTASADATPFGLSFKPDGTKVFILGGGTDEVNEFSLDPAWDLSSLSATPDATQSVNVDTLPRDIHFNPDGTEMFILGYNSDKIYKYTLNTAWDLSDTITLDSASLDMSGGTCSNPIGMGFNSDGTVICVGDANATAKMDQYNLSTAYDLSTATLAASFTDPDRENSNSFYAIFIGDSNKSLIALSNTDDTIYQYDITKRIATLDLSTGSVFELTPTSSPLEIVFSNPPASGVSSGATLILDQAGFGGGALSNAKRLATFDPETGSVGIVNPNGIDFSGDGTKLFVKDFSTVYRYSLSTAFDISTATFDTGNTHDFSGQTTGNVFGFRFGNSGTKLYVLANTEDKVYQYTLSTAYDLSGTVTYNGVTAALAEETSPTDLDFNSDGTQMFITGTTGDNVEIYNLGTAWDITGTVTHDSAFAFSPAITNPQAIRFNSDGTIFYVMSNGEVVSKYNLSTAYDFTTAVLESAESLSLNLYDGTGYGLATNNDDTKLYYVGYSIDIVHEFFIRKAATFVYDDSIKWAGDSAPTSPEVTTTSINVFNTVDGGTTYDAVVAIEEAS